MKSPELDTARVLTKAMSDMVTNYNHQSIIDSIEKEQIEGMDGRYDFKGVNWKTGKPFSWKPSYMMKFYLLCKDALKKKYDFRKWWTIAEGQIWDVMDKTDGQEYTIRILNKKKDWRDEEEKC